MDTALRDDGGALGMLLKLKQRAENVELGPGFVFLHSLEERDGFERVGCPLVDKHLKLRSHLRRNLQKLLEPIVAEIEQQAVLVGAGLHRRCAARRLHQCNFAKKVARLQRAQSDLRPFDKTPSEKHHQRNNSRAYLVH